MAELLRVPAVAAGATEVILAEWLAEPGHQLKAGDPIAIIETEKANVEIAAETDATLLKTLVEPGITVAVGMPMALLGGAEELDADLDALIAAASAPESAERGVSAPDTTRAAVLGQDLIATERQFATPIARKMLRDAGLAVDAATGTGPNGRITRRDVEQVIAARATPAPSASTPPAAAAVTTPATHTVPQTGAWTDLPHSRLRQAVASRLTASKQQIPHFYIKRRAVLDGLLALRAQLNDASSHRLTINDFMIRAMALAHLEVPDANVIWTDENIRRFTTIDIAVAVASARGLVTPVLRGVEGKSVSEISHQVRTYVETANTGKLHQGDLDGGSIAISNLGMFGVDEFTAIINPPQSAILAVGAARRAAHVDDDAIIIRTVVDLVLSVDHRAIDGALAAQWMQALVAAVEHPYRLVL